MKLLIFLIFTTVAINHSFAMYSFPETMIILSKDQKAALLIGPLDMDAENITKTFLSLPQTVEFVQLEVTGGRLDFAMIIANEIQKRGLTTFTYTRCISACTFMFLAGKNRMLDETAYVVFHQIQYYDKDPQKAEREQAYWQGRATQFYLDYGLDEAFTYSVEATYETKKRGKELESTGYYTEVKNYSLENFPSQFSFKDGTVLYPKDYVDPSEF